MMGKYNPEFSKGLDTVFDCLHFDWLDYGENSHQLQIALLNSKLNFNPDYIFMHIQSGNVVRPETLIELKKGCKIINWTGDVRYPLPEHYIQIGSLIDLTLYTNTNDVFESKNRGINADFLQVGFDKTEFNPLGKLNPNIQPILFLGSNYPHANFPLTSFRKEMVLRLKNDFGNMFGVYGGGWDNYSNGIINNYKDEGCAYRSCKIAINLSHFDYGRYSSDRMFRILGSGAFCLTHKFKDIEKDFKLGKEVETWNNLDELVNKINYYLNNNYEREKIAINGCALARTKYTWYHFAKELDNIIKKNNL